MSSIEAIGFIVIFIEDSCFLIDKIIGGNFFIAIFLNIKVFIFLYIFLFE